eukprot:Pgem_evm2s18983
MVFYENSPFNSYTTQEHQQQVEYEYEDNIQISNVYTIDSPIILSKINSVILVKIQSNQIDIPNNSYIEIEGYCICFYFNTEFINDETYIKLKVISLFPGISVNELILS